MKQFDKAIKVGLRVHGMPGAPTTVHLLMVDLYSAVHDRDNLFANSRSSRKQTRKAHTWPR